MFFSPESQLVSPTELDTSKCACSLGRLRSQSMISTSAPVWANMNAVLIAVVVFPSDGWLEVTKMVLGAWPAEERSNEVRKWRYDSATWDRKFSTIARAVLAPAARASPSRKRC